MSVDYDKKPDHDEALDHLSADEIEDEHAAEDLLKEMGHDQERSEDEGFEDAEGELLGDLLDEVADPSESETVAEEEHIAIEPRPEEFDDGAPEEGQSHMLPTAIIVIALVGAIGYFASGSSDKSADKPVAATKPAVSQTAEKPVASSKTSAADEVKSKAVKAAEAVKQQSTASDNSDSAMAAAEKSSAQRVMKPLLSDPEPVAMSAAADTPAAEADMMPQSPVAETLVIDPVTRKVISSRDGKTTTAWAVNLISLSTHAAADRIITMLNADGTTTELVQITIGDQSFYRIRVPDFASVEEADQAHARFKENPIFAGSWVSRYRK